MSARVGVVGHVEWVQFAVVERVPRGGRDRPRARDVLRAGGRRRGGGGAAAQARRLGGVLDRAGRRRAAASVPRASCASASASSCSRRPRRPAAARLHLPRRRRRAHDHGDRRADRAAAAPTRCRGTSSARWTAIYFTGGDAGAVRAARAARVLVATPRAMDALAASGVQLDVLVRSAGDPGERTSRACSTPRRAGWSARAARAAARGRARRRALGGRAAARAAGRRLRLRRLVRRRRWPTGWAPAWSWRRRSSWARAAGRRAVAGAGRTGRSSRWRRAGVACASA